MADPTPPPSTPSSAATPNAPNPSSGAATYKAPAPNRALRMMGIPGLPKKLPSRNWLIFWTLTASLTGAIIYDKREKKRATARWSRAVAHLAKEPLPNPTQMPRRLTIFLEAPPNDGLRVAQDHFTDYVKPILAASGLDWDFVQGRKEGDVRAAVAERIRRTRQHPEEVDGQTQNEMVQEIRQHNGTPEFLGVKGDIVLGRHTWKEYVRGVHEGWLGPLEPPHLPEPEIEKVTESSEAVEGENKDEKAEKKPERPPQPPPYNTTNDYPTSAVPMYIPAEFHPSKTITFPHILGFSHTFVRLRRFLNRRYLADDIGREVAAVCFAAQREYREDAGDGEAEQEAALKIEERDWPKSVWKKEDDTSKKEESAPAVPPEKIWGKPMVLDPRISMRMRKFEIRPEDEARAKEIVVPEEEVEGWIKGSFRGLWRWAVSDPPPRPNYSTDD